MLSVNRGVELLGSAACCCSDTDRKADSSIHQADQVINLQLTVLHFSMDELLPPALQVVETHSSLSLTNSEITFVVQTHSIKC